MLKVLTWLWHQPQGRSRFNALHVNILHDMVRRHLSIPHRFACVTDMPQGLSRDIEVIEPPRDFERTRIPTWNETRPQCLRRLAMFRPDAADIFGAERFVSLDLDCTIGASLDPLFDADWDFRITIGTASGRFYNGSMVGLKAGARPQVYTRFTPERAAEAGQKFIGSDQAWISYCLGQGEQTWGAADGIGFFGIWDSEPRRIRFHVGREKPWHCNDPWTRQHYRMKREGRCLLLGYGPSLWSDVERALAEPFTGVVASPEAAEHWPGEVLAVAPTNPEAERLAYMLGFDETTWCGLDVPEEAEAA